jgi:hypothetical protein
MMMCRNLAYYLLSLAEMTVLLVLWILNLERTASLPLWNYSTSYQVPLPTISAL